MPARRWKRLNRCSAIHFFCRVRCEGSRSRIYSRRVWPVSIGSDSEITPAHCQQWQAPSNFHMRLCAGVDFIHRWCWVNASLKMPVFWSMDQTQLACVYSLLTQGTNLPSYIRSTESLPYAPFTFFRHNQANTIKNRSIRTQQVTVLHRHRRRFIYIADSPCFHRRER